MPDRAAPSHPSGEPISPELVLVDPDLAQRARRLLPDHTEPALAAAERSYRPGSSAPVVLRARRSRRRRLAAILAAGRRRLRRRLAAILAAVAAGIAGVYVVTEATLIGDGADTSGVRARAAAPAPAGARRDVKTVEDLLAAAATPSAARALLGEPASREPASNACRIAWPRRGLTLVYAATGGRDPCRAGNAVGVLAGKRGFASADGLRVGDSLARLRRLYPAAESRPDGWWALAGDGLLAHVGGGHVDTIYATR